MPTPIFGVPVAGVTYEPRQAAYAVIRNSAGAVAAVHVHVPAGYWLPGGGSLPGESSEETVVREVSEEFGYSLRLIRKIGRVMQYFFAATEGRYYAMHAVFFLAELVEGPLGRVSSLRRVEGVTRLREEAWSEGGITAQRSDLQDSRESGQ